MTRNEYVKKVLEALDECDPDDLSLQDYADALEEIASDVDSRLEAAKSDLANRDE